MKLTVYTQDGSASKRKAELADDVFGIEPNEHAMYLAVKVQRAHMRQGTHASKSRSMVRGGGRKPWRQKGRGAARAGTIRSPLWRHGGTIFGPHPHPYTMKLSKKANRLARASALSTRAAEEAIRIVEDFNFDQPKTKQMLALIEALELAGKKVLLLTPDNAPNVVRSARNVTGCSVRVGIEASALDLLNHEVLLIMEGALDRMTEVLRGRKRTAEKAA